MIPENYINVLVAKKYCSPCIMSVQYTGGCAVQWGMFSTPGDIMSTVGGFHEYTGGCSVHGGYHEYTGEIS